MQLKSVNQPSLFPIDDPPLGLVFEPEIMSRSEEEEFLAVIRELSFGPFIMHGIEAKRRIANFDLRYTSASRSMNAAPAFPSALEPLRVRAAQSARVAPVDFAHVLVTEYQPGAGIGWHHDLQPFGIVAGISFGATCRMRFQRGQGAERETWAVELPPRSLYVLTGEAREQWQHSIPAVTALRYSITFRTLREQARHAASQGL